MGELMMMSERVLAIALVLSAAVPALPAIRTPQPVREIQVVAKKFSFEPSTIEVAPGEQVRLVIRSADTDHGFAIKKLKIDVEIPKGGRPVTVEFTAPPAGRYEIECSDFCGFGHRKMKAELVSAAPIR